MDIINLLSDNSHWGAYTLIVVLMGYGLKYLRDENKRLLNELQENREAHYSDIKKGFALLEKVSEWIDRKKYGGE